MIKNRPPDKIDNDGDKFWYDDNHKFHNDNGYPAEIWTSGSKFWFKHGKRHNENAPAEIYSWGEKCWFINDIEYTEEEFKQYKIKKFITNDKE